MRPIRVALTPQAANTTGFDTGLTGAGPWTLTTQTSGDSLAHLVALTSTANLSAITFTITGTDPDGNPQTEDVLGPNITTVNSTKYFATVTDISASSTLGANTLDVGWDANGVTKSYPLIYNNEVFSVGMGITITGTINYTIQHTFSDVWDHNHTNNWFDHASLVSQSTTADGNYAFNCFATRFEVNSVTAGATVVWEIVQGASD